MSLLRTSVVALVALACGACRSTYYDYRFAPVPQEASIAHSEAPGSGVRALVSLNGVRRAQGDDPVRIEGRLRVENVGTVPATLRTEGLEVVTADLRGVFPGRAKPVDEPTLEPGDTRVYELRFPLPDRRTPDDYDFDGLALKWDTAFGDLVTTSSASFQRVWGRRYDDPFLRPSFSFGVGYVR